MRYLVTGGAGFIGSAIVRELVARDQAVTVMDDLSTGRESNLDGLFDRVDFHRSSITDVNSVRRAAKGADFVVHLAARTSVPRSVAEPAETNTVNVSGTLNVLIAACDEKVRRLVYAASSSAYGETPTLPKVEAMTAAPISPYGVSKFVGELYAQVFTKIYHLETVCLRFFNVFGPRQDPSSPYSGVLARFMLALIDREQPVVFGDGEQSRDFTFVENVVDAVLRACTAPGVSGSMMNIATGSRFSLNETLRILERITGRPARARYDGPRAGDILHSQANIDLARELLGYEPQVGFEEGLRRTWEWYLSNSGAPGEKSDRS